ncbi:phosphoenolpyruvate synthase [Tritonibacter horizontis]|uniref:Phosphoenolpyruvate synthase n=2 Tax=Tritonibacter horizontis TaxID=1768241 RepID=A0A132BU39_9RHOB|nr:phosphoenolpyruvate synthase [Tritonibacter horizontis]
MPGNSFRSEGHLVTTLNTPTCITRSVKIYFCLSVSMTFFLTNAAPALAIPSPELVLGSVSSLSQILALVVALLSGFGAMVAGRLGLKPGTFGQRRYPVRLIAGLVAVAALLAAANHWQWQSHKTKELQRLQATLSRPAQFDGTTLKDPKLKETSYTAQETHPQGITTAQAAALLASDDVRFFDIRETAEHEMGTLPGATHVRFPDFQQSVPVAPGERVVLFCHNGNRSSETCAELAKMGIDCSFVAGGIEKWIVESRPFSDAEVQSLSDLRAIPDYENKSRLLSTDAFTKMVQSGPLQIVDTRYPGNFAAGHLPGAINIPIRAITTEDLRSRIAALEDKPTVVACYDRRSCFMGQVLGLELTRAGLPFAGRYTLPWEYFVAPPPKPHVSAWLAEQNKTVWTKAVAAIGTALLWGHERAHLLVSLFVLALVSRLMVLPIALKSERDQITLRMHKPELQAVKSRLAADPMRKSRAIQAFYAKHGLTPMRNLTALLFLPLMMLGLQSAEFAATAIAEPFLWVADLGAPDPSYMAALLTSALGGVYLFSAMARDRRSAVLWLGLGVPLLFVLTMGLSTAGNVYLSISLAGLLLQHFYVSGKLARATVTLRHMARLPRGVVTLDNTAQLAQAGNKALRLSQLANAGFPVPDGIVLTDRYLAQFEQAAPQRRQQMAARLWRQIGPTPCAVRSSASQEDGADQSFAGVFDSVLDVTGPTLPSAIETVLASFGSARAQSYGGTDDTAPRNVAGAGNILIQHMIEASYAGVLFTQDPQAPGMMLLEWVAGKGEDLVSGRATPKTARFGRYSFDAAAHGAEAPFDARALLALGRRIETLFDAPQDVEWAWTEGQFYILQSRDITTTTVGSAEDQARAQEWRRLFATVTEDNCDPQITLLEQDEMSEVLPRPTPLSFSLMSQIWAPGGSLDLACRALRLPYTLPEAPNAHLIRLFGKTYVDTRLKQQLTMDLSGNRAIRLKKQLTPTLDRFAHEVLPALNDTVEDWRAIRFEALPRAKILDAISRLKQEFVTGIYVEAEKINLLSAFAMKEATSAAQGDPALRSHLMQADLHYTPASLLAQCHGTEEEAQAMALQRMGHRAMFDYELSTPRYAEAPSLLFSLMEPEVKPLRPSVMPADLPTELRQLIDTAVAYQDLKERAKHEAMRLLAELRRALVALGAESGLDELVFHLTIEELLQGDWSKPEHLRQIADARRSHDALARKSAPTQTQLSLADCEQLSAGSIGAAADGPMHGTCVAGSGEATGRAFRVADEASFGEAAFVGFAPGDIILCDMVNPAWLPQLQQAGAVVSAVGGWLSHMAIVAREKDILMLVGATGLDGLEQGETITVTDSGEIRQPQAEGSEQARRA